MQVVFEIVPVKPLQKQLIDPVQFTLRYKTAGSPAQCQMTEQPQLSFTQFNQLSKPQQFACAVVWFGSLLRMSKYVKSNTWNDVISLSKSSADLSNFSQMEFAVLVEQAKKLYGKKRKKEE
jgi:Ca-activated chloride channel family protein